MNLDYRKDMKEERHFFSTPMSEELATWRNANLTEVSLDTP